MHAEHTVRHPNFFIVGASRAGTTSLWQYLFHHPDIFLPAGDMSAKEPSYFCDLKPCWARNYVSLEQYLELFSTVTRETAIGEASTPYLVSQESAGRLHRAYPDARIIIILRNPADRAWSLYRYLCLLGVESIPSFEQALAAEDARRQDEQFRLNNSFWYYAYLYFSTGLYAAQLQRYLAVFPRHHVHVLLSEDLEADPTAATQKVCEFLGVDASWSPTVVRYNESRQPFSLRLQHFLGHDWSEHPMRPQPHASATRYRDDIEATAGLIGRSLDHWLAGATPASR
jgi:hypothetical protein